MRALGVSLLLAACASTTTTSSKGGPRGLRASDHIAQAHEADTRAEEARSWPDRRLAVGPQPTGGITIPWHRSFDSVTEYERRAARHRSSAAAIYAEYDEACSPLPPELASVSPLERHGLGGWNTSSGVVVYLAPGAGSADHLMRTLRCHRAWMMLAPANMDDCPLDLPGLQIDARGDDHGITLVLGVHDPKLVGELQRRVAHDLEAASHPAGEH